MSPAPGSTRTAISPTNPENQGDWLPEPIRTAYTCGEYGVCYAANKSLVRLGMGAS